MFRVTPDDPKIVEMDPIQKMWMYENWIADKNDQVELAKNHAYLLASFWDPETVKQIVGGGNVHKSTDEEFEESMRMVKEINGDDKKIINDNPLPIKRKRRRVIQE